MTRFSRITVLAALALCCAIRPALADDKPDAKVDAKVDAKLDAIEKKLNELHDKCKSYSAKMTFKQDVEMPGMGTSKTEGTGMLDFVTGDDDKTKIHMEMSMTSEQNFGGQAMKQDMKTITVSDGETTYTLVDNGGQKMVIKNKADSKSSEMGTQSMEQLKKDHDLKVLDESKFDGADCFVIEATPKQKEQQGPVSIDKFHFFYRKDNGVVAKMIMFDAKGKQVAITETTEIKLNPKFKDDHFKFTPPEGVQVMDMSNMENMGG